MTRFTHVCKFCIYANFTHISKSVHVSAIFPLLRISKICIYTKFAICLYANLHICKSVHVTGKQNLHTNLYHINVKKALIQTAIIPKMTE